jgi:hypothetical protein
MDSKWEGEKPLLHKVEAINDTKWKKAKGRVYSGSGSEGDALVGRLGAVGALPEREAGEEPVLEAHIRLRPTKPPTGGIKSSTY